MRLYQTEQSAALWVGVNCFMCVLFLYQTGVFGNFIDCILFLQRGPFSALPILDVLTVFSYDYCLQFYPDVFDETMICAGKTGTWDMGVCHGDTGAPLICGDYMVAVASWNSYSGISKKPPLFTSVYHHLDWIGITNGTKIVKTLKLLHLFLYILSIHIYL